MTTRGSRFQRNLVSYPDAAGATLRTFDSVHQKGPDACSSAFLHTRILFSAACEHAKAAVTLCDHNGIAVGRLYAPNLPDKNPRGE